MTFYHSLFSSRHLENNSRLSCYFCIAVCERADSLEYVRRLCTHGTQNRPHHQRKSLGLARRGGPARRDGPRCTFRPTGSRSFVDVRACKSSTRAWIDGHSLERRFSKLRQGSAAASSAASVQYPNIYSSRESLHHFRGAFHVSPRGIDESALDRLRRHCRSKRRSAGRHRDAPASWRRPCKTSFACRSHPSTPRSSRR